MSEKTSNCPFCGSETWGVLQGGRWLICGQHKQDCPVGCNGGLVANSLNDWNRRATQPTAGEPVAWMVKKTFNGREKTLELTEHKHVADFMVSEYSNGTERLLPLYTAPPAAARGDGRSDADYAIEHGRYLANDADKFMKALNDAFDPETEETDLNDESISEARKRLASSVYEFRKRADRAMQTKGAAVHGDEAVRKDAERYRWLVREAERDYVEFRDTWFECEAHLTEAIDAAMRALGDGES